MAHFSSGMSPPRSGAKAKFALYRETLRTTGAGKPRGIHRQGEFATIPSPPLFAAQVQRTNNTEAPQYAFSKAGRNLSVRCGPKTNPGARPTTSRWSAPVPGKRTRREDHALLIVRDEFRTGYSLIGLLASRARRRFTGTAIINTGRFGGNRISSNGIASFPSCLTEGVHPRVM
jgi:hypothetical protein